MKFILLWAVYSSFFTPVEFGFFRGLLEDLVFLDITGQITFLIDIVIQLFLTYRDTHTYCIVYKRTSIALRSLSFLSSYFLPFFPFAFTIYYCYYTSLYLSLSHPCLLKVLRHPLNGFLFRSSNMFEFHYYYFFI